jgi:hypothetical protein
MGFRCIFGLLLAKVVSLEEKGRLVARSKVRQLDAASKAGVEPFKSSRKEEMD